MSKKVERAGIIPYIIENNEIKMLFMVPSDPKFGTDFPQIGKGKQEDNESPLEAALREGNEELGLFEGNIAEIHDLGTVLGRTTIYVAKIKDKDMFGDFHHETEETLWMTPEEFYEDGRELHIPVVKAAVRLITKEEKLK
jgi:8-oxo-dGTP pyrophosphatase MutT (NUDIX family)